MKNICTLKLENIAHKIKRKVRYYYISTVGAIAIMFAILAPVLVGAAGMSLDYAMAYLVQQRLGAALDAAALAGAASSTDEAVIEQKILDFFRANYPEEGFGTALDPEVTIVGDQIKVSVNAYHETTFLKYLNIDTVDVQVNTTVNRAVRGIEVALVLDVTGSMGGSKIASLRDATNTFIDTIFNRVSDSRFLKVGLVPYAATVNVGSIAPDIVNQPPVPGRPDVIYDPDDNLQWAGCVMARNNPHDEDDTNEFDGGKWDAFWWEHTDGDSDNNPWDSTQGGSLNLTHEHTRKCNNGRLPNLGCPLDNPIVPLTSDRAALEAAADDIVAWCRGGTLGNIGMSWGWRVLSPEAPFTEGADYNSYLWRKAVVMMTDGENQLWKKPGIGTDSDFSAYGYIEDGALGTTNRNTGVNKANERFVRTCERMKALGITIHTVVFGSSIIGKDSEQDYIACASSPDHHHRAANGDDLVAVYEDIARELSNLHISE